MDNTIIKGRDFQNASGEYREVTVLDGALSTTSQLSVEEVIGVSAYDLAASAYSQVVSPSYDYIIDNASFEFSTTQSRTITITSDNGSKIYEATSTNLSVVVSNINFGQTSSQSFTVAITQTGGACTVDVTVNIKNSPVALTADPITAAGSVTETVNNGFESTANGIDATLTNGEVSTGTWEDVLNYNNVIVGISVTAASATDGLVIQWSHDGTHVDDSDTFTISASANKVFTFTPARRYVRIVYTNGSSSSDVDLQTLYKKGGIKASSHRIQDSIVNEDDAELVKAVLTGENGGGVFKNVQVTADGDLTISDNSSGLSIAQGNVTGQTNVNKFGNAPDFDTGDGEVDIWDGANDAGIDEMSYTFSTTADIDRLSSSNAGDTQDIEVQGLDTNYDLVTQTITLTGQTPVPLTTTLIRVFRLKNVGTTDLTGDCYCFVNSATTGGVPNTTTNVRAVILNGNNQTEMAIYTIPAGKTGYLRQIYASTAGGSRTSNYVIKLKIKPFGQVFQLKHRRSINDDKDLEKIFDTPEIATEKADIIMTAETTESVITGSSLSAGFDIILVDN